MRRAEGHADQLVIHSGSLFIPLLCILLERVPFKRWRVVSRTDSSQAATPPGSPSPRSLLSSGTSVTGGGVAVDEREAQQWPLLMRGEGLTGLRLAARGKKRGASEVWKHFDRVDGEKTEPLGWAQCKGGDALVRWDGKRCCVDLFILFIYLFMIVPRCFYWWIMLAWG